MKRGPLELQVREHRSIATRELSTTFRSVYNERTWELRIIVEASQKPDGTWNEPKVWFDLNGTGGLFLEQFGDVEDLVHRLFAAYRARYGRGEVDE